MTTHAHRAHDRHEPEGDVAVNEHNPMYPPPCGYRDCPHHPMGSANCNTTCPHHGTTKLTTTDPRATAREDGGDRG